MKSKTILILFFAWVPVNAVFAGCLIAHDCWMGSECVEIYLISLSRHDHNVKVRTKDVMTDIKGHVTGIGYNTSNISCKTNPDDLDFHFSATNWSIWMAVCKGKRTYWSTKEPIKSKCNIKLR